jgi:hypothetical protein
VVHSSLVQETLALAQVLETEKPARMPMTYQMSSLKK